MLYLNIITLLSTVCIPLTFLVISFLSGVRLAQQYRRIPKALFYVVWSRFPLRRQRRASNMNEIQSGVNGAATSRQTLA